jgi:cytochrome c556
MQITARWLATLSICVLAFTPGVVPADQHKHDHSKLPPGPIRDRHELMEAQGQQAENIKNAFNMGVEGFDVAIIQRAAQAIAMSAGQIPSLFPKGSTDPNSRALPAIWDNWDKFTQLATQLQDQATSLANAADSGQDEKLNDKAKKMFATCKSCHDQFRRPEKKKGK